MPKITDYEPIVGAHTIEEFCHLKDYMLLFLCMYHPEDIVCL